MLQKTLFNMLVKQIQIQKKEENKHSETIQYCKVTNSPKIWTMSGDWTMVAMNSTMRSTLGKEEKEKHVQFAHYVYLYKALMPFTMK